ncbi:MAG: NAD(P)/FAD-dependent oxidoreductase [Acidimicrobiia bacterium]
MSVKTDVAIVGGGPGGTASALFLARQGIRSVIVERDEFPRFHIGESMTGECGRLVRELGFEDEMIRRGHAIKHGVTVFGTGGSNSFWVPVMRRTDQGELEPATTWQVRRSEFDSMLLATARAEGVELIRGEANEPIVGTDGSVKGVHVTTSSGSSVDVLSDALLDATGRKTWLARTGLIGPKRRDKYDRQIAVFSHLKGAVREPGEASGNTIIFYQKLLHWAWFIPLDDEVVSVGVVTPTNYFRDRQEDKEAFFLRELRELNPELAKRVEDVEMVEEVRTASNYSYFVDEFTGPGYLCVGDSHRFIDPIFSFGLYLTISDAEMAVRAIGAYLDGAERALLDYQDRSNNGLGVVQDLIDAFWSNPLAFGYVTHFTQHREGIIDIFAGRIYGDEPLPAQLALRRIVQAHGDTLREAAG